MKHFHRIIGIMCLLFVSQIAVVHAQTIKEKSDALISAGARHYGRPDSLNYYADQLIDLTRPAGYAVGEGWGLKFKGMAENGFGHYKNAIAWYEQALEIFTKLDNELEVAKAQLNISIAFQRLSDHKSALVHAEKALYLFEKLKDRNGIGRVLNVLGIAMMAQKDYPSARDYFLQYNKNARELNLNTEIVNSYNSLGSVYTSLKKLDSAIFYLNNAVILNKKTGNKLALAHNYQNIGIIYLDKKDYRKALDNYDQARELYAEVNNKSFWSQSLLNMAQAYKKLQDTAKSKAYFQEALLMANQAGEKEVITQAYHALAQFNIQKNNYKEAYENFERSVQTRDSIRGAGMMPMVQELKVKYDTYKKQQQIRELKQQAELHRLQIRERNLYLTIGASLVLLAVITGSFIVYWRKLKERRRREEEKMRYQDLMTQETLNAEERERRRIGHDLHDGVGQLLTTALMNLNSLVDRLKLTPREKELAGNSISLVSESYDEIRSISHQIIPNALLKAGLAFAIKDFLSKIDHQRLKVNLDIAGLSTRLDDQTETVLYRVIQETVTNVIKHSVADLLTIQMVKDEEGISVTIEDNGKGFDPAKAKDFKGTGLRNIQSRIAMLKGTVEFDTKPGRGTLVAIYVPEREN